MLVSMLSFTNAAKVKVFTCFDVLLATSKKMISNISPRQSAVDVRMLK